MHRVTLPLVVLTTLIAACGDDGAAPADDTSSPGDTGPIADATDGPPTDATSTTSPPDVATDTALADATTAPDDTTPDETAVADTTPDETADTFVPEVADVDIPCTCERGTCPDDDGVCVCVGEHVGGAACDTCDNGFMKCGGDADWHCVAFAEWNYGTAAAPTSSVTATGHVRQTYTGAPTSGALRVTRIDVYLPAGLAVVAKVPKDVDGGTYDSAPVTTSTEGVHTFRFDPDGVPVYNNIPRFELEFTGTHSLPTSVNVYDGELTVRASDGTNRVDFGNDLQFSVYLRPCP